MPPLSIRRNRTEIFVAPALLERLVFNVVVPSKKTSPFYRVVILASMLNVINLYVFCFIVNPIKYAIITNPLPVQST
ncbi:MAG: hypothetical protein Q6360_07005 [Candidatus Brocadiales bacterium]|nr:hypothetical protein [Candidatus Brocadiales bacterium]